MTDNLTTEQRSATGVYAIRAGAKKRVYVGAAQHLGRTCSRTRWELRQGQHGCRALQAYASMHPTASLRFEVLALCPPAELAATKQRYLDHYQATDPAHGFNSLNPTGPAGQKMGAEARARISASKKGRPAKRTAEHQEKLAAAHRGRKRSPETCAAISAATRGKPKRKRPQ